MSVQYVATMTNWPFINFNQKVNDPSWLLDDLWPHFCRQQKQGQRSSHKLLYPRINVYEFNGNTPKHLDTVTIFTKLLNWNTTYKAVLWTSGLHAWTTNRKSDHTVQARQKWFKQGWIFFQKSKFFPRCYRPVTIKFPHFFPNFVTICEGA